MTEPPPDYTVSPPVDDGELPPVAWFLSEAAGEYEVAGGLGVRRRWVVADGGRGVAAPLRPTYGPLLARVLWARGRRTLAECEPWLAPQRRPWGAWDEIVDLPAAAARVAAAIDAGAPVAIYGDYDVDGLTATAILALTLRAAGVEVACRLPDRLREGYGLHAAAVSELADWLRMRQPRGRALLVAVDCGTSDDEAVALAGARGVDVVVLDHHAVNGPRPAALAFVNPRRLDAGAAGRDLTAAGLALQLTRALLETGALALPAGERECLTRDVLALAALGTLADVAPLTDENRALVTHGLLALRARCRPGLAALLRAAGVEQARVDSEHVSWRLAPRLNAAGRMAHPDLALRLLLTEDAAEAAALAARLEELNGQRQVACERILAEARAIVQAAARRIPVLAGAGWSPGLAGLVAGRLAEEIGRPVVVLGREGEIARGSARSRDGFNIAQALDECRHLLMRYGGHSQAAGLTVACEQIAALEDALDAAALRSWPDGPPEPALMLDATARLDELDRLAVSELGRLAPFGRGNEEPLWLIEGVEVIDGRRVGRDGHHLQFRVRDGRSVAQGIAFRQGERLPELLAAGRVDLACTLRLDEWQGQTQVKLFTQDFRPAQ